MNQSLGNSLATNSEDPKERERDLGAVGLESACP